MTTPELSILIASGAAAIVSVVNSIAAGWGRKEVREQAKEVKQVAKDVHEDIVNKVADTTAAVHKVANGDIAILGAKVDALVDRVGHIENWMITERTSRTRSSD